MLLKEPDDKSKRLRLLEDLQKSPLLNPTQKTWLDDELQRLKLGLQGEREAAFHIDSLFKDGQNTAVLHDLRLIVDDEAAQIDHLIFNRFMDFILVETKCYSGNVQINPAGEFTVQYGRSSRFGVHSPLAQSERHGRVLAKLLAKLGIAGRMGVQPKFHHLVLFHPKAIIDRPPADQFDTSNVIKADQIAQWREKWLDQTNGLGGLTSMLNMRGRDTIQEWAAQLVQAHCPADLLALPDFMKPSAPAAFTPGASTRPEGAAAAGNEEPQRRLICATCGSKISFAEGKFCWNNAARFGGAQYCREHQSRFS